MKMIRKIVIMCMTVLLFAGVVQTEAKAADYTFCYEKLITTKIPNHGYRYTMVSGEAEIVKVTQDKRLAKVEIDAVYPKAIMVYPKKIGTTTLNVTVKSGDETKDHKVKLKVYKYKNPAKTIKIGNVEYKNKFKKSNNCIVSVPKKTKNVKCVVKPTKGYKILGMSYSYNTKSDITKRVELKSGRKFKLRSLWGSVQITFQKKSTGQTINLAIFYRN